MSLYPLKFKPLFLEKMWGGRKIQTVLGKPLDAGKNIGESWELYDLPPGAVDNSTEWISAEVSVGPLAGRTLHELVLEFGRELHGDVPLFAPHGQFPMLIKFLDARVDLSIQVHPDQPYVDAHPGAYLKNEAWYIVQNDPGAQLYLGLTPGTTEEQFRRSISEGHCEKLLNSVPVKPGDCYYLPSGTVHAVGAGILAAEIQTPSDTTYRVYDFNRIDPTTGKPRKLHIDQALACIHFGQPKPAPQPRSHVAGLFTTVTRLASCDYFKIEKVRFAEGVQEAVPYDEPVVWVMLEGQAEVKVDDVKEPIRFGPGETVLLPAVMKNPVIKTITPCVWLEVTFPAAHRESMA